MELHYGSISAHNLDQGCEFVISLPLGCEHLKADEMATEPDVETAEQLTLAEVEDSDETAEEPIESPNRQRPLLVIAEDDEEIRNYLVQELSSDYEIKAFSDVFSSCHNDERFVGWNGMKTLHRGAFLTCRSRADERYNVLATIR